MRPLRTGAYRCVSRIRPNVPHTTPTLRVPRMMAYANVPLTVPLTVAEAAHRLHVSRDTVRRLIARGELAAYRVGVQWRIESADVAAYIHDHRAGDRAGGSIA